VGDLARFVAAVHSGSLVSEALLRHLVPVALADD